ncbi:DgyrCDS385 [Dimorphilus gyrociliatus]|uniref:DgyrCDS385 n=1 Tax=Dimorphilus gyrociliatus TaxID=2664684 RepID=A0A7I8V4B4_9ANNE|nr:DgyrCDS385 [Dimorphilus gyrociliatus]
MEVRSVSLALIIFLSAATTLNNCLTIGRKDTGDLIQQSKPEQRKASQTVQKQSLKTSCNSTNGSCEDGECCDDESGGGCCPKDYVVCCADGSNCCPGRAPICCGGILSKSYCCDDEAFCCLGGCCFNENPDNMKKSNILSVNRINPKESLKERNVPVKIGEKKD